MVEVLGLGAIRSVESMGCRSWGLELFVLRAFFVFGPSRCGTSGSTAGNEGVELARSPFYKQSLMRILVPPIIVS